jgi:hypothetical protein
MTARGTKASRTEWAAVFLTSAELVRRGYVVSLTMGNRTPMADLMAGHPESGKQFWVDVKGMFGRSGGWFMHPKPLLSELFYILVSIGIERSSDKFFILSQQEANGMLQDYRAAHPDWNFGGEGFSWKMAAQFEDRWQILPT